MGDEEIFLSIASRNKSRASSSLIAGRLPVWWVAISKKPLRFAGTDGIEAVSAGA
jgi:hypothetical protein